MGNRPHFAMIWLLTAYISIFRSTARLERPVICTYLVLF